MTDQQQLPAPPANLTEASARLSELGADRAWGKRLLSGDVAAAKEFDELTTMVAEGGDKVAIAMSGALPAGADGEMREMAGTSEMLRELGIRDDVIKQTLAGQEVTAAEYKATKVWLDQQIASREFAKKLSEGDPETRQKFMLANIVLSSGIKSAPA